jgi:uncharacterized BrkB/YihY/UPF0761 family membrane protein
MERTFAKVEEIVRLLKEYINARIELVKIDVIEIVSIIVTQLVAILFIVLLVFGGILFAGVALAIFLAEWTGKLWFGYLLVSLLFLLVSLIFWINRGKIIRKPLINGLLDQLFADEKED